YQANKGLVLFLLAKLLNFQGTSPRLQVGSLSSGYILSNAPGGVYVDYDRLLSGFGGGITKVGWQ
ncbi:hypothetical protein EFR66_08970, partial [Lactobacillus delbrueckii subsp. lactis]|nr:hypothetical protein [Lactobacillus delbrueckii subsp. lactis]